MTDPIASIPGLAELRAQERLNRALAFAGLTHTVCGLEIAPLTPAHRLGLQLVGSAFVRGDEPSLADIAQFLWFLSPDYERPAARPGFWAKRKNAKLERRRRAIAKHVAGLDESVAGWEVKRYLAGQLQDTPATSLEGGSDQSAYVHWIASDASFWLNIHGGFTLESFLATPYLVLQQLMRAWQCNHPTYHRNPDGSVTAEEPTFINRSDQLLGNWHNERKAEVAEFMRQPRERLN